VIAALSLIVYLIAYRVRLAPETVAAHVEDSRHEAEIEERELGASPA
jgi:hypothetical protein